MRIYLLLAFFVLALSDASHVCAQQLARKQIQSISYQDEQHLIRKGNDVYVVSISIEWPERVANSDAQVLQRYLCYNVFGLPLKPLKQAKAEFLSSLGEEIDNMPQESTIKKTYVSIDLKMLAWVENAYLSMKLVATVRDGNKLEPDNVKTMLFSYDVHDGKILEGNDIISLDSQRGNAYASYLNYDIYSIYSMSGMQEEIEFQRMPDQACLMPDGVLFNLTGSGNDNGIEACVLLPTSMAKDYIKKSMYKYLEPEGIKRLQSKKTKESKEAEYAEVQEGEGAVYDVVTEMPQFEGGDNAMMEFISKNTLYPKYERENGISGKVVVQFVVNSDGTVSDPAVIKPLSPGMDREAARAIMLMPKWKPGTLNGQPVNVKVCVPVTFKIG